ncbi:MAG TPA: hypothetical protein VGJ16_14160 [Pirellulales bacterium]|jgi:hypothetical protein
MPQIGARGLYSVAFFLAIPFSVASLGATASTAAAPAAKSSRAKAQAKEVPATVDMFDGMKSGDLDVKLIAMDATQGNVIIKNKTKKPLSVKLPNAFAGVPVLAQRGGGGLGGGGGMGGMGGMNGMGGGMNQGMGGGMGGMGMGGMGGMGGGGMGGMGMGGMGGMMNIPAEKTTKFKVPLVCLEHGKLDPRASVPYEIRPIESFTQNTAVQQLCSMLGEGQLNQRVAQVAAWNLANGMSFEQLAAKQLEELGSPPRSFFTPQEVQAAMGVANQAVARGEHVKREALAKGNAEPKSPGESQAKAVGEDPRSQNASSDDAPSASKSSAAAVVKPARRKVRSR